MEPALFSKAIVVGPHMENFGDMAKEFEAQGALLKAIPASDDVNDRAKALAEAFIKILSDPMLKESMGRSALNFFEKSKGATAASADSIDCLLKEK
jgi:3-deoxy-D-manno-octulosonic-acid transferase